MRGREGLIVTAVGEEWITLLELLGAPGSRFASGERLCIGRSGRAKVSSVLGKIPYERIPDSAKNELFPVVTKIVSNNESRFVEYLNTASPITTRVHALELILGVGKAYMNTILEERDRQKFVSYHDLQERVGLNDPARHIAEQIVSEVMGQNKRMNVFVRR